MYTEDEVNALIREAWEEGARRQRVSTALELGPALERLEGLERYVTDHAKTWPRLTRMVAANVAFLRDRYIRVTH